MNKRILHRPELRHPDRALLVMLLATLAHFFGWDARAEAAPPDSLRAGLACACITPEEPLWLHQNRRLYHADGRYRGMGPNANKYVDDSIPVLRVCAPDGTMRGIVFGCACHPVTFGAENLKLSGEVVSGYVPLLTRALDTKRAWIAGYCNEVDGYLPDATIVAEGGYEARGLVADIGFYSADAEQTLVKAVRDLQ